MEEHRLSTSSNILPSYSADTPFSFYLQLPDPTSNKLPESLNHSLMFCHVVLQNLKVNGFCIMVTVSFLSTGSSISKTKLESLCSIGVLNDSTSFSATISNKKRSSLNLKVCESDCCFD